MAFYPFAGVSTAPSGPAGGALSGTYPNPGVANPIPGNVTVQNNLQTTNGFIQTAGGVIDVSTAGKGLQVAEGTNAKQGTAVLAAGTVTVANTTTTANSRILASGQAAGGTPGGVNVSTRTAGTSFTLASTNAADTSTVAFEMFEPG